jgi:hypothetical protein
LAAELGPLANTQAKVEVGPLAEPAGKRWLRSAKFAELLPGTVRPGVGV